MPGSRSVAGRKAGMSTKLHTAANDKLGVKRDGLQVSLSIWTPSKPVRSIRLYATEVVWLVQRLEAAGARLKEKPGLRS